MAYQKHHRRPAHGGGGQSSADLGKEYEPKVDKNPFYRTNDIFNACLKKKVRLDAGDLNCTDLKTIWVNFSERLFVAIVTQLGKNDEGRYIYALECGHQFVGSRDNLLPVGKRAPCWTCSTQQAYLGFEHEWQHIAFKSNLAAQRVFTQQYAAQLRQQAPHVDQQTLEQFLHLFINAFDDLRCNSLWEKYCPGSAQMIWARWKRLTEGMGDNVNSNILCYIFAVAFDIPTDPQGEFESMRPVIEWGIQRSKYRGFMNMLVDVKAVLERCMGAILARIPPPPPKPPQPQQPQQPQQPPPQQAQAGQQQPQDQGDPEDQDSDEDSSQDAQSQQQDSSSQDPSQTGGQPNGQPDPSQGASEGDSQAGQGQDAVPPPTHIPAASSVQATPKERSDALAKMMAGAQPIDSSEEHKIVDTDAVRADPSAAPLAMAALGTDTSDLEELEEQQDRNGPDTDMQDALDKLNSGIGDQSKDSILTADAKAKVQLIDVTPEGASGSVIELNDEERFAVSRLRAHFHKTMGKKKAQRGSDGAEIDIDSYVQFSIDHQDSDVFSSESQQQGFAYHVLTDMSGSMNGGPFNQVCHAVEMLKKSLAFPFVRGELWGFRGGEKHGEVWLYRYDRKCVGYTGSARVFFGSGKSLSFPVACGGITPMNTAIRVTTNHVARNVPAGMVKRMFLLTDGSPFQQRLSGRSMPEHLLRQFVAKEINIARQRGIQVYTLVIGDSISDDHCRQMFGMHRFWKRVNLDRSDQNSVDRTLTRLVLDNFTKYLKARG